MVHIVDTNFVHMQKKITYNHLQIAGYARTARLCVTVIIHDCQTWHILRIILHSFVCIHSTEIVRRNNPTI